VANDLIGTGQVISLCINGSTLEELAFSLEGPRGDAHTGFTRQLGGHDGEYTRTSDLKTGAPIFNWRAWSGLSAEEIRETEDALGAAIPPGCLLENIIISGIPNFSKLPPTTRLVFPARQSKSGRQAILAVWEENTPCSVVGARLAALHDRPTLKKQFVSAAANKRGVVGIVLAPGEVRRGDEVRVYSPTRG
jgi:hypothetical protein